MQNKHRTHSNRKLVSSIVLLNQVAIAPALANSYPAHASFAAGPNTPQAQPHSFHNNGAWQTHASTQFLPATFGLGVVSLPTASQSLPLPQAATQQTAMHQANLHQATVINHAARQFATHAANLPAAAVPAQNVQLDLTSNSSSIVLDSTLIKNGSSVTIQMGAGSATFHVGDKVTAGELVAIEQAQVRTGQTIKLDDQGRATGGTFSLNNVTNAAGLNVSSVVVPNNVTAIDRVAAHSNVSLSGDLINYGSIVEVGLRHTNNSANISAQDIINEAGGLITSKSFGGLTDLSLTASQDFTNMGTISSSGNLNITAGGNLINNAAISAPKDISLQSTNIINTGAVVSSHGNINLGVAGDQSLAMNVNNTGGTLSAVNGAINVRQADYAGTGNTSVIGGDLLSKQLNLNSGSGMIDVNVNELTGTVTSQGEGVHVQASTDNLVIGKQCLVGDPTYYNDSGDIEIAGNVDVGEDLAIVAAGNITVDPGVTSISANNGTDGKNITMIAGAFVVGGTGSTSKVTGAPPVSGNATSDITILGGNATGGNISLPAGINLSTTAPTGKGGDIVLAAYSAGGANGKVTMSVATQLDTTGPSGSGNVLILAGGISDFIGKITANDVTISGSQPSFINPLKAVTIDTTGAFTGGNAMARDYSATNVGFIQLASAINATGNVNISGDWLSVAGGSITAGTGSIVLTAWGTGSGKMELGGNVKTTAGGNIVIAGAHDVLSSAAVKVSTDSSTTNAGSITIIAGANFTESATSLNIIGGSNSGGNVDLTTTGGAALTGLSAKSSNPGGSGGNITLVSFDDVSVSGLGSKVITPTALVIATGGNGAGSNGDVTVVAGNSVGTAANKLTIDTTGGANGTGNINLAASYPPSFNIALPTAAVSVAQVLTGQQSSAPFFYNSLTTPGATIKEIHGGPFTFDTNLPTTSNIVIESQGLITVPAAGYSTPMAVTILATSNAINLDGSLTASGGLLLAARLGIATTSSGLTLSTYSSTGNSGNMTIVSGALFSETNNAVTVTGASDLGGAIDFKTMPLATFEAKSTNFGANAGNINLVAMTGTLVGAQEGSISLPSAITVNLTATDTPGGNFQAVAGATTGTAIDVGSINTVHTNGPAVVPSAATLTLQAATPAITPTSTLVISSSGTILSGNAFNASTAGLQNATIAAKTLTTPGGTITISTNGSVQIQTLDAGGAANVGNNGSQGHGGTITLTTGSPTDDLYIGDNTKTNFINSILANGVAGGIAASGGTVNIAVNSAKNLIISNPNAIQFDATSAPSGKGGNLTLADKLGTINFGPLTGLDSNSSNAPLGGLISITAKDFTWDSKGKGTPFTIDTSGGSSAAGDLYVENLGTTVYSIGPSTSKTADFSFIAEGGNANVTYLSKNAAVNLDGAGFDVTSAGSLQGSRIFITALGIHNAQGPIVLDASAATGSGGTVQITDLANENIVIGTGAGSFQLSAQGGSAGVGGTIVVNAKGSMIVDPSQIDVGTTKVGAHGGFVDLEAGSTLLVNGNFSLINGDLKLVSNSATPFTVGGTKLTNGITGTISVGTTGSSVIIQNLGGALINNDFMDASTISLSANGPLTVNSALGSGTTAKVTLVSGKGGAVTATKAAIQTVNAQFSSDTGAITVSKLNATQVGAVTDNAAKTAVVAITNINTTALDISSAQGSKITIVTPGNLTSSGAISGGPVTLTSTGKTGTTINLGGSVNSTGLVTVTAPGAITFKSNLNGDLGVKVSNKDANADINFINNGTINTLAAGAITITSGGGSINQNSGTVMNGAKTITLTAAKGTITLGGAGGGVLDPLALTVSALKGITVAGALTVTNSIALKTTSTVTNGATIVLNQGINVSSSKSTLTITSGSNSSIDDSTSPFGLSLKAGTVTLAGAAGVNLTTTEVTATTKTLTVGSTKGGVTEQGLSATLGSVVVSSFSSMVLNGPIIAGTSVTAKTVDTKNSADIFLHHNITAGTAGSITLTAVGQGAVITSGTKINPTLQAGTLTLTGSTGVDLSFGVNLISTSKVITLTAAKGDVSMNFNGKVDAATNLTISALNVTSSAPIKAVGPIVMTATDKVNGQISLSNNIQATGPGSKITLTANAFFNNAFQNKGGTITADGALTIKGATGAVTNTGTIQSKTGAISITGSDYDGTGGTVQAGTNVTITGVGKDVTNFVTVGNTFTDNGSILVKGAGGTVGTSSGVFMKANATDIKTKTNIVVNNTNTAVGKINIDGTLWTVAMDAAKANGNITIAVGTVPTTGKNPIATGDIPNITVSHSGTPGQVFGGVTAKTGGIVGSGPGNATLSTVNSANVILNTPSAANPITFAQGSTILADPPPPSTAAVQAVAAIQLPSIARSTTQLTAVTSDPIQSVQAIPIPSLSSLGNATQPGVAPLLGGVTVYQMSNRTTSGDGFNAMVGSTTYGRRSATGYGPGTAWISDTELVGGKIPAALQQSAGESQLDTGALLVASDSDSVVKTALGNIAIKARSLVLVLKFSGGLAVYNLHDTSKNAVQLEIGGQTTAIQPGRSVIVATGQRKRFEEINPAQLICYGPLKESNLASDLKVFHGEFSLPSAINAVPSLRNLLNSGNARDRKLAEQFLKTTSIMMQLRGNTTNFRQVLKPQLTACNQ
ncbi:MAG: S-layer family protein [Cyanobacteria bacterium SZAS LIN-3]|nr:S-layer family protein [Cyanobacteria bacterium SZAS LIN-3]